MKTAIKSQNRRFLWKNIQAKTFKTSEKFAFVLWEIPDFEWGTRYLSTEQQGKKPKAGEVIWATQASALKGLKFKKIPLWHLYSALPAFHVATLQVNHSKFITVTKSAGYHIWESPSAA